MYHFLATSPDLSSSEDMEEVTDEPIARTCHRDSEQISEVLESVSQLEKPNNIVGSNASASERTRSPRAGRITDRT